MSSTRIVLLSYLLGASLATAGEAPVRAPDDPGFTLRTQEFNLRVFPEKGAIDVSVLWDLEVRGPAPRAELTAYLSDVADVKSVTAAGRALAWKRVASLIPFFSSVVVTFPSPLGPGERAAVTFTYTLAPAGATTGLAAMNMAVTPEKIYFFECWYPTITPFIDDNTFVRAGQKPPFTLRADLPAGFTAITAGRLVSDTPRGATASFEFESARPAPFLIPIVAGKFTRTAIRDGAIPIDLYAPDGARASGRRELCAFVARSAALQAQLLSQGPPARLALALMEAGGLARGFPGLVIVPPSFQDFWQDPSFASTLCHELAHTYFGNLVTAYGPGGNEFLSEGLAAYAGIKLAGAVLGSPRAEARLLAQSLAKLMRSDTPDAPIVQVRPMQNVLSGEVYSKGALVFNELSRLLGQDELWKLLGAYVTRYAGAFVTLDEFRRFCIENAWPREGSFDSKRALLARFFVQYLDTTALPWVQVVSTHERAGGAARYLELSLKNRGDGFGLVPVLLDPSGRAERHAFLLEPGETRTFSLKLEGSTPGVCSVDPDGTFLHGVRRASMLAQAATLRAKGETVPAREAYERLVARIPEAGEAWYGLGRLEDQAGDAARAAEHYAKAAALGGPEWLPTWGWIREAQCRVRVGDVKAARVLLNRVAVEGNDIFDAKAEAAKILAAIKE